MNKPYLNLNHHPAWDELFNNVQQQEWFVKLLNSVRDIYNSGEIVYPSADRVFRVFSLPPQEVKVVILGQDPYHNGSADGLAFSTFPDFPIPKSLKNMFKAIAIDFQRPPEEFPKHGNLEHWAKQGVFLLNTSLTVGNCANTHKKLKWNRFTQEVIKKLNQESNIVFLLFGKPAQEYNSLIDSNRHCIINNVHPSPLSYYRGFADVHCFLKCNEYLKAKGIKEITW